MSTLPCPKCGAVSPEIACPSCGTSLRPRPLIHRDPTPEEAARQPILTPAEQLAAALPGAAMPSETSTVIPSQVLAPEPKPALPPFVAVLLSAAAKRLVVFLLGLAFIALSSKFGINLTEVEKGEIVALVLGFIGQSAMKEASITKAKIAA